MATAAVLTERAESLGLPITKNAFEGTLENPVPSLPYMVYLLPREATAGADSRPNHLMADTTLQRRLNTNCCSMNGNAWKQRRKKGQNKKPFHYMIYL